MTECIRWWGKSTRDGYGLTSRNDPWLGRRISAHRMAWAECFGEIPTGLCVLHKCDNKWCVNPDHLFLGTKKDNIRDAMSKGRVPQIYRSKRGNLNPNTKISDELAARVRSRLLAGEKPPVLAKEFNVTKECIYYIRKHRHV